MTFRFRLNFLFLLLPPILISCGGGESTSTIQLQGPESAVLGRCIKITATLSAPAKALYILQPSLENSSEGVIYADADCQDLAVFSILFSPGSQSTNFYVRFDGDEGKRKLGASLIQNPKDLKLVATARPIEISVVQLDDTP